MARYHPKVFLPDGLVLPQGTFKLRTLRHSDHEARKDGMLIPSKVDMRKAQVFEVVHDKGYLRKLGLRMRYAEGKDICMVVAMNEYPWPVISAWANSSDDHHDTLNPRNYATR